MKTVVILNPGARKVDEASMGEVELAVRRLGEVTVRTTDDTGGATDLARQALAEGADVIVAVGGDGTINEVVNGLAQDFSRAILGIIPLGTGNDFARSINVPADLDAAVDIILSAQVRTVDVVHVSNSGEGYFINMSAGGFSGQVDENLTDEMKASWGPLAYLRSGLETLPDLTAYRIWIQFDDEPLQELDVYNIVVANARFIGGGIPVAPEAQLDDGLVDVLIVPVAGMAQLVLLTSQILLGQHMGSDLLVFRRAQKVSIRSEPSMSFNIDGELIGEGPVTFEVLPGALRVITGPEPPGV